MVFTIITDSNFQFPLSILNITMSFSILSSPKLVITNSAYTIFYIFGFYENAFILVNRNDYIDK